jgi:hypothetical protein
MKKSLSLIVLAAAFFGALSHVSAASTILYTEDWGTTNGGGSFAAVGWSSVVASPDNPPYVGFYAATGATDSSSGNPLPKSTAYYTGLAAGQTGMFYTVAGTGGDSAFTAIDCALRCSNPIITETVGGRKSVENQNG